MAKSTKITENITEAQLVLFKYLADHEILYFKLEDLKWKITLDNPVTIISNRLPYWRKLVFSTIQRLDPVIFPFPPLWWCQVRSMEVFKCRMTIIFNVHITWTPMKNMDHHCISNFCQYFRICIRLNPPKPFHQFHDFSFSYNLKKFFAIFFNN